MAFSPVAVCSRVRASEFFRSKHSPTTNLVQGARFRKIGVDVDSREAAHAGGVVAEDRECFPGSAGKGGGASRLLVSRNQEMLEAYWSAGNG